jgi:ubiquinone/menaquinone biosynthesis C-methylase UbiE
MSLLEINKRYSELATTECCLSCGGAINYALPKAGEVCVDLGSGRGTDVLNMADEVGENGFVYGIDVSEGMLEKACQMALKFDVKNVSFIQSDLEKIALPDRIADLVISNCTINHASDKHAVWNEVYRILKHGGRFVVSDIYATSPIAEEYHHDPVAVAECWAGAITKDQYLDILNIAGLREIEIIEESKPYSKGKAEVVSFTIAGKKPLSRGCGCSL